MSYRSKRTRAEMEMKNDTESKAIDDRKNDTATGQRWGPFCPSSDKALGITIDKDPSTILSTNNREQPYLKPPKPQVPQKRKLGDLKFPPSQDHVTHSLKTTTSSKTTVPKPNIEFNANYSSNSKEDLHPPKATKTTPIWKTPLSDSSKESQVRQVTSLLRNLMPEKTTLADPKSQHPELDVDPNKLMHTSTLIASTPCAKTTTLKQKLQNKTSIKNVQTNTRARAVQVTSKVDKSHVLIEEEASNIERQESSLISKSMQGKISLADPDPITQISQHPEVPTKPKPTSLLFSSIPCVKTTTSKHKIQNTTQLKTAETRPHDVEMTSKVDKSHVLTEEEEEEDPNLESSRQNVSNGSKPLIPRRRTLVPDWPDDVEFDEKEEVVTIGKYQMVKESIQPHDVWHANGVKYFVSFNEYNQPLRKGGHILIKFIGSVAKTERFCPIRETNWRHVNAQYKVDIIKLIRAHFVIPDGESYDEGILKRTGRSVRLYRHYLKKVLFKPSTMTKAQIFFTHWTPS